MELRVFTEPQQGASYEDLLRVAKEAERLGFAAFFRSDHYLHMGSVSGLPGPTDSWVTLGALARETDRIRLGTLMTAATFRHPGPLAISVAQVDEMSGGRVEFGFGTGWYSEEHAAYGIPFPTLGERFDRFEEQLEILVGLWATPIDETFSFKGTYYELKQSPARPKPTQRPHPPVLIGGRGEVRTPRLAARFADEYNLGFCSLAETKTQFARVNAACERAGRDPSSLVLSVAHTVCVGENEEQIARRAAKIGQGLDALRENHVAGTPEEAIETISRFKEIGAGRAYLQFLDLADLDHLRLVAERVMPALT